MGDHQVLAADIVRHSKGLPAAVPGDFALAGRESGQQPEKEPGTVGYLDWRGPRGLCRDQRHQEESEQTLQRGNLRRVRVPLSSHGKIGRGGGWH